MVVSTLSDEEGRSIVRLVGSSVGDDDVGSIMSFSSFGIVESDSIVVSFPPRSPSADL